MAYFAVVAKNLEVQRTHVNVWRYDGWVINRVYCFDVGLGLKAPGGSTSASKTFDLALPFSFDKHCDLSQEMRDPNVAQLIFGRAVSSDASGSITYVDKNKKDISFRCVSPSSIKLLNDKSGANYSLCRVELADPPDGNEELYVRIRFHVADFSRSWIDHAGSEIVDIRVADTRESVSIPDWRFFERDIAPLRGLRVFIIAPARLEPRALSRVHVARGLERSVWSAYTGRRTWFREISAIYGFEPDEPDLAIGTNRPFRLYFGLVDRQRFSWWRVIMFFAGLATAAAIYESLCVSTCGGPLSLLGALWVKYKPWLISLLSIGGARKLAELLANVRGLKSGARRLERWRLFEKNS